MKQQYSINHFWKLWTVNCALGELIGIACAGAIAFSVNFILGDPQTIVLKLVVLFSMLVAGFIEGFVLGLLQWKVLVSRFSDIPKTEWIYYTVLVGVLGWFLGMLPSLFFITPSLENGVSASGLDFSNPLVFAFLSIFSGLFLGAIFGLFQWFSLRKYVQKAYKWIIANALGWGLGLGWIYLFASIPTEESNIIFTVGMGICGGILAGLSVGAITGFFLISFEMKN